MKKVAIAVDVELVSTCNLSDEKYYGIVNSCREKGFITRYNYKSGNYLASSFSKMTYGNRFIVSLNNDQKCLKNFIELLINMGFEVFEFDTYQKLLRWGAE